MSAKIEPVPNLPNLRSVAVTMSVTKMIKGKPAPTLTFRQFLWDAHDTSVFAFYKQSGELLLFLNPVSSYGLTSPVGLEQGRFRILRDSKGGQYVVNGRGNLGLFNEFTPFCVKCIITLKNSWCRGSFRRADQPRQRRSALCYLLPCVNCQPKRPLMQRFPRVTEWSSGELTFTICPDCACTVSSHPTPQ